MKEIPEAVVPEALTDELLISIETAAKAATPGPWHIRFLDDDAFMNIIALSTVPDTGRHEAWPKFDSSEIIAATLIQSPAYVDVADEKWDENAAYIALACNHAAAMAAEIRRLRDELHKFGGGHIHP